MGDTTFDYFVQSLSYDENIIALQAEEKKLHQFRIFLYNLETSKQIDFPHAENGSKSNPAFSPRTYSLAYLCDGKLRIYNLKTGENKKIRSKEDITFKTIMWSHKGQYIFLNDESNNIWRFTEHTKELVRVWESPIPSNTFSNMISPIRDHEKDFYFVTDMGTENAYDQVYRFRDNGQLSRLTTSNCDKLLNQQLQTDSLITFRTSKDGFYELNVWRSGSLNRISPTEGVVYDYVRTVFGDTLVLYADYSHPGSIYIIKNGRISQNLITKATLKIETVPEVIINKEGIFHLIYRPKYQPSKWIVWIHGGPYEQISKRYNSYFTNFVKAGIGVIALNYPGSTGIGNSYEIMQIQEELKIKTQLSIIYRDLKIIQQKNTLPKKMNLIGISYGSLLAHQMANDHPDLFESLIDFSGIYEGRVSGTVRRCYIFGKYDYTLSSPAREELLQKAFNINHSELITIQDEGHIILRRNNIEKITNAIVAFLSP
jgi:pimeloyl-ACP methyl ester carboxylesterase